MTKLQPHDYSILHLITHHSYTVIREWNYETVGLRRWLKISTPTIKASINRLIKSGILTTYTDDAGKERYKRA